MNAKMLGWITALTLGSLIIAAPVSRGQDKKEGDAAPARRERPNRPAGGQGARLDNIAAELNLSDDQKDKFKTVMKSEAEKMKALRDDTNLSQEDRRAKSRDVRKEIVGKVKEILNAEQFEKWQKSRQAGGPRRGAPGAPGGPGQPKDGEKKPAN